MERHVIEAYRHARKRLLLLDYDGTLTELRRLPHEAAPNAWLINLLRRLTNDRANTVVIVSGRNHTDLEAWLGELPLYFAAEHGLLYKAPGKPWHAAQNIDDAWKDKVRHLFQHYTDKIKGTFIEEKTNGLVWHYRSAADTRAAKTAEQQLVAEVQPLAALTGLRVMQGSKIVEVQPLGVNKGIGAAYWLAREEWDFMLAAGDDVTDEDMFTAMPPAAYTIKIGSGETTAQLRLNTPAELRRLLAELV